jgi:hypothetical protein
MRNGFISSCVRGRQLQSRDREAVIPTKEDFDWLGGDFFKSVPTGISIY